MTDDDAGRPTTSSEGRPAPIVVGIDGSTGSAEALSWAAAEAELRGVPLRVIHAWALPAPVVSPGLFAEPDPAVFEQAAEALLAQELDDAGLPRATVEVEAKAIKGYPPSVLLEGAHGAALLVLGTRGRGGFRSLVLGSVSQHCATHAEGPVAVVPAGAPPATHRGDVVVGVDGSAGSAAALAFAYAEAALRGVRLSVVHGWWTSFPSPPAGLTLPSNDPLDYVHSSRRMLRDMLDAVSKAAAGGAEPREIELLPLEQAPAPAVLERSAREALLVVGSRGRGGFAGLLLGSVSQQCLHHSRCAVVVVPTAAERSGGDDVAVAV